jgi:hypothetical protein
MENTIFDKNPSLEEYHQTSDGQAFYTKSNALNHARTLEDKAVKTVSRGDVAAAPEPKAKKPAKLSADDTIAAIEKAENQEQLDAFKDDKRSTVVAAFEKRTKELAEAGSETQKEE